MSAAYQEYRKLMTSGQFAEAARLAEAEYFKGDASNPFWLTRQATALSRAGQYESALSISQHALSLEPTNPYAVLTVAEALRGLKRMEEALAHYEEIVAHPKLSISARTGILNCLSQLKQWNRMLQLLQQWGVPPEKSYRWRVQALAGQHRLDEAMEVCRQWLKSQPDLPSALWTLTELEIQREGLEPVLARMAKLAKIASRPPVYKEIYASLCRRAGKPDLALQQYTQLTRGASDFRILRKQAFALSQSGKKLEAIAMLEELLKSKPSDYFVHTSYLAACKRINQLERAAQFYKALLEANPEQTSLYSRIRTIEDLQHKQNQR